jgi:hypothetical protein
MTNTAHDKINSTVGKVQPLAQAVQGGISKLADNLQ